MQLVIRAFLFLAVALFLLPESGPASIIFRAGEKAKYVPPGEEEMSGNAAELYQIGQTAEKENNPKRAIRAYKTLNYRNRLTNILQQRIHISSWSKDIPVACISTRPLRASSASVRFILMERS